MKQLLFLLLCMSVAQALPALGDTLTVRQPDGSTVQVRVWGDEFYRRVESLDGYTLLKSDNGWTCYAEQARDGEQLVATTIRYNGAPNRTALPMAKGLKLSDRARAATREAARQEIWGDSGPGREPIRQTTGEIVGVTILIDFPDDTATISAETMSDFMNKEGFNLNGNNGSVRDYFLDVSNGKLDYRNEVVGYYRAQHPKSYYEQNNLRLILLDEAYRGVDSIFDFTTVSYNIKAVKAVNVLYAGPCNSAWGQGLWPMAGNHRFETDEGLILSKFQMAAIDTGLTIGPTAHENGHMLFNLGDLYSGKNDTYGIGYYCLMCYGCFVPNPTPINAYYRAKLGWDEPVDLTDATLGTNYEHKTNSMSSFVYRNPKNSKEKFYIESRRWGGRNSYLTDQGLIVWHVDGWKINQTPEMTANNHSEVSLEQADGKFDLELMTNIGDTFDLYGGASASRFDATTSPNSDWWRHGESGLILTNISEPGKKVTTFTFGEGVPVGVAQVATKANAAISVQQNRISITAESSITSLSLYSLSGRNLQRTELSGSLQAALTPTVQAGVYLLSVETTGGSFVQKVELR